MALPGLTSLAGALPGILFLLLCGPAQGGALTIGIRGHAVTQEVFSLFAAPGEEMRIGLASGDVGKLRLTRAGEPFGEAGISDWILRAPLQPGLYPLLLEHLETGESTRLHLFVGSRLPEGHEQIEGYRIGPLPNGHSKYPDKYLRPGLYFRVTPDNVNTQLSEHFTLRQFLCKQESGYPKYVIVRESLLILLEGLIDAVRDAGYPVDTFGIVSGYRTPDYNRNIGNVPNSRHVYGDAMDFYVDRDNDGVMDDLNGDGDNNRRDVDLLYGIVDEFKQRPENQLLFGGVGSYYKTRHHGGFVHVDTRGFTARW